MRVKRKPVLWVASSRKDLKTFPHAVQYDVGHALLEAQDGGRGLNVKMMQGFGGGTVLEVISDFQTDTYRAVYTVRFEQAILVLHCFQKKSKRGVETPKADKDLIEQRLREARETYARWLQAENQKG